jgi:hypothetical protein
MRALRSALSLAFVVAASGCAPEIDDACFKPRTGNETSCEVFDLDGTQWNLDGAEPLKDADALCAASCIDAPFTTFISISNYHDLRKAPLLAKFRHIENLAIDVEGLPDLRGLENVSIGSLRLSNRGGDMTTFRSLDGLGPELDSIEMELLMGLTEFDGARFTRLGGFTARSSALERISFASLEPRYVSLSLDELRELALGGGTLNELNLLGCPVLPSFNWQPGLKTLGYNIQNNSALSSCLVQDFINTTYVPPKGITLAANNGPCP